MPWHEKRIHRRNFEFSEAADRKNWSPIGINRRRKLSKKDVTFGKQFSRFESGIGGRRIQSQKFKRVLSYGGGGQVCRTLSLPFPPRFYGLNYRIFEDKTVSNLALGAQTWQIIDGKYIYNYNTNTISRWPNILF